MTLKRLARAAFVAAFAGLVATTACSSDPEAEAATYCSVAKSSGEKCEEPSECDEALAEGCTTIEKVVSPSTINAAKDCLESGVCGVASCLSRAQKNATPTAAHKQLASNFCEFCAPNIADCEKNFYSRNSKLPGLLVLPYAESVIEAVDDECTGKQGCAAKFSTCATEVITRVVSEELDSDLADCVVQGFRQDEGEGKLPGGGPTVATCTSANCKGCCRDDKCEEGTTMQACGLNASACETCGGAQKCTDEGKCKEPCGPNNCNGCCDGDTCLPGNVKEKCGGGGGTCKSCTTEGSSFVCSNKQCIDSSCQATCLSGCCSSTGCKPGTAANACGTGGEACIDCGVGRRCQAAACTLDPTSKWDVYISFAVVPDKNKQGFAWDPLEGAPDCKLTVYTSQGASVHSGSTTVQQDSTVPFWAETPIVGVSASELLNDFSFEIVDDDYDFDDIIGGCSIPLSQSHFDGSLLDYTCPATPTTVSVQVYYRINPSL